MPRCERLGPALLLALLAASLLVTALVYRARTPDLALEVVRFQHELTPNGDGRKDRAGLELFVRFDEPSATISIVGQRAVHVRTLADGISLEERVPVRCVWDGRDDAGVVVPSGFYRLRVVLPGQDRDMIFPRRIDVSKPVGRSSTPSQSVCAAAGESV